MQGAQEVFKELPHEFVSPDSLEDVIKNGGTYTFRSSADKLLWYGFTVYIIAPHLNEKMAICSYDFPELQTRRRCMVQWLTRRTTSSGKMAALSVRKTSFKTQENTSLCSLKRYIVIYPYIPLLCCCYVLY